MSSEYDFTQGERGKYAGLFAEGTNLVAIDADLVDVFPDARTVNDMLRVLAGLIREQRRK